LHTTFGFALLLAPKYLNFQQQIEQEIKLKYFNAELNIGLVSWREAYVLFPIIKQMNLETYKGRIIYRLKGSA
jgi:hypothetical protein